MTSNKLRGMTFLASLVLPLSASAAQQAKFDPAVHIRAAIDILKKNALMADSVDWEAVEKEALSREVNAKDAIDTFDTIDWLLKSLGDHHSFPQFDRDQLAVYKARYGMTPWPTLAETKRISTFTDRREPAWHKVITGRRKNLLHLIVPMRLTSDQATLDTYASTLLEGIQKTAGSTCGYIVDLRGNMGGNEWPMVVGLGPLLGNGVVEGYHSPKEKSWIRLRNGEVILEHSGTAETLYQYKGRLPRISRASAPTAILIDDATASSGEGTAISFEGRPNTRFFGIETSGNSTSNEGFQLPDGTNLVVTTDVMADRTGRAYPNGVKPQATIDPTGAKDKKVDRAIAAARTWLLSQPACR